VADEDEGATAVEVLEEVLEGREDVGRRDAGDVPLLLCEGCLRKCLKAAKTSVEGMPAMFLFCCAKGCESW